MELEAVKERVCAEVDRRAEVLISASRDIHAHPELGFEEHFAHDLLTDIIAAEQLDVIRGACDLPTAFRVDVGSTGPTVAVLCEYDALPGIGHACGHNIIATAGLGAGLAAAAVAEEVGGRIRILGTPAEEGGGGKVLMAERGAFEGVDAALMVHPAGGDLCAMDAIAVQQVRVDYTGLPAHAAAFPHKGRNALDAAVLGYMNVAALRQHIRPEERIHGIFSDGGDKPNIVPSHAGTHWYVRAATLARLEPLKARVLACLEAGALAAGCEMSVRWLEPVYADMVDSAPIVECYVDNAARLGRTVLDPRDLGTKVVGSTDMGNVSYLVPSIHPMIAVAPPHVGIHTPEFAEYTASDEGDAAVVDGAKALAMTVVDLWMADGVLAEATERFGAIAKP